MRVRSHGWAVTIGCVLVLVGCSADGSAPEQGPMTGLPATAAGPSAGVSAPAAAGGAGASAGRPSASAGRIAAPTAGLGSAAAGSGSSAGAGGGAAGDDEDAGVMSPPTAGASGVGSPTAGASGMASPTAGASGMASPTEPPRMDLGEGDGSDVITIGDSWMNLGATGIQQSLVRASGQPYRTYGRGGTRLLDEVIPNQYATAKRANADIKTVVMTGGGNDIIQVPGLRDDCDMMGERCAMVVEEILDRLTALWTEMAMDGVQDVVYVQYSNPEGNNVDFAQADGDGLKKRCEEVMAPMRCHRLETLDLVMGDIPDGIHPSGAAYDRIGEAVHEMMVREGLRR